MKFDSSYITLVKRFQNCRNFFNSIAHIPYAYIKGDALSVYAYGKTGLRISADIDILIPFNYLNEVENCLYQNGFESTLRSRSDKILMLSSSHQTAPWKKDIKPWGSAAVDINFDILWGEYENKKIDILEFLSDTKIIEIYGCKVKTLNPLKTIIQLALHHYKDMNSILLLSSGKSIKYNMFKDIFYLLKNNQVNIQLKTLYSICKEYNIVPYIYYVLYFTDLIFNDEMLKKYVIAFQTKEGEELVPCYGLSSAERRMWKVDFFTRLTCDNTYELIKEDLTDRDFIKINSTRRIFLND